MLGYGLALAGSSCSWNTKKAFAGYAFVATRDSGDVAIVDLAAFTCNSRVRTAGNPVQLVDIPGTDSILSVSVDGALEAISFRDEKVTARAKLAVTPGQVQLAPGGRTLWTLSQDARKLLSLDPTTLELQQSRPLPSPAASLAVSPETAHVAVHLAQDRKLLVWKMDDAAKPLDAPIDKRIGEIRFLKNGTMILATQPDDRELTLIDTPTGKTIVRLPLPLRPDNLCFSDDGGQLFITGEGLDGVVVVYPFQSQVAATLLSGKSPGPMAASSQPQFLFVTSPSTDTVSVLDIRTQKLAAVVAVGGEPRFVALTPDNQMALVLNRKSGDIAIIRLANIVSKRHKTAPLFTMIPVGSAPVAAVIRSA